jgi:hypothetical protein
MISVKPRQIKEYLMINRMSKGLTFCRPKENEQIMGIPYGWVDTHSTPYIQHVTNGIVTQSVNCSDVSIIIFEGFAV